MWGHFRISYMFFYKKIYFDFLLSYASEKIFFSRVGKFNAIPHFPTQFLDIAKTIGNTAFKTWGASPHTKKTSPHKKK